MATALLLIALVLGACSSGSPSDERLAALEAEVAELKAQARAGEKRFMEELAQIRTNLEAIRGLVEVEQRRAEAMDAPSAEGESGDALDKDIDTKAKSFVSENLDRLLAITKKLLDKMEQELDERMKEPAPEPEGDRI